MGSKVVFGLIVCSIISAIYFFKLPALVFAHGWDCDQLEGANRVDVRFWDKANFTGYFGHSCGNDSTHKNGVYQQNENGPDAFRKTSMFGYDGHPDLWTCLYFYSDESYEWDVLSVRPHWRAYKIAPGSHGHISLAFGAWNNMIGSHGSIVFDDPILPCPSGEGLF